ncbi:MAG: Tad domain-containing protein [Acidimicrobiia bacterium]
MARRLLLKMKADNGASLVLIAVSMMLLIGMAAMAVDLGALRSDIRADGLAADAAVTAGVAEVDPFSGTDAKEACEVAWEYLLLNIEDEGTSVSPPNCALLSGNCMPAGGATRVPASAGDYSFEIVYPVPDGDDLMVGQAINPLFDGVECQRLGVSIERNRDHWFARVLGFSSITTNVGAVARHAAGPGGGEIVPLLVLEPISCDALFTSGQGRVTVSWFMETPGFIVVDSNGSKTDNPNRCGNNQWTIDSKGTQNGWIRAIPTPLGVPSVILSYALSGTLGSNPARAYDVSDLTDPAVGITDPVELLMPQTWFRLYPTPSFVGQRITRSAIDHRYNCKSSYPDYPLDLDNLGLGGISITPCIDPLLPPPHIDNLVTAYGGSGSPLGFQRWTTNLDGTPRYPCTVDDLTWGPATIAVAGDWWVDCPGGGLIIGNSKTVVFSAGNVVVDGNIQLKTMATLQVNPVPSSDHVIFIRDGDLIKFSQSSIFLNRTMVFLQDGRINIGAGSGGLTWTAPLMGNFEDLALWAEARLQYELGGQATNTLTGTFFTPFADPFSLTGQSGQFQTDAQFITRRLEVKGQGLVTMHPDPDRSTPIPIREVRLIR